MSPRPFRWLNIRSNRGDAVVILFRLRNCRNAHGKLWQARSWKAMVGALGIMCGDEWDYGTEPWRSAPKMYIAVLVYVGVCSWSGCRLQQRRRFGVRDSRENWTLNWTCFSRTGRTSPPAACEERSRWKFVFLDRAGKWDQNVSKAQKQVDL